MSDLHQDLVQALVSRSELLSRGNMRKLLEKIHLPPGDLQCLFDDYDSSNKGEWDLENFVVWLQATKRRLTGTIEPSPLHMQGCADETPHAADRPDEVDLGTLKAIFEANFQAEKQKVHDRIDSHIEGALEEELLGRKLAGEEVNESLKASVQEELRLDYVRSHPAWSLRGALGTSIVDVVAENLLETLAPSCDSAMEIAFARAMAKATPDAICSVLKSTKTLEKMAEAIHKIAVGVSSREAATGAELNDKFNTSAERGFSMDFGTKVDFFKGLEKRIGSPGPKLLKAIVMEHCCRCDSHRKWTTGNYGITTDPFTEFLLIAREVVDQILNAREGKFPADWVKLAKKLTSGKAPTPPMEDWPTEWPVETKHAEDGRRPETQHFLEELLQRNSELHEIGEEGLKLEEGMMLRLYTGPMFEKYNAVPRGGALDGCGNAFLERQFRTLCCQKDGDDWLENRYPTSIHVLTSGVVKLSKLTKAETVYRGLGGNMLPKQFWNKDKFGCKGGVEYGFMSTTANKEVATRYAGDGSVRMVLEIETGSVDRGADLRSLSQYPNEKELLFPPLTSLEVRDTFAVNGTLIVKTRVNINLTNPTIDEVIAKRHKILTTMAEVNMMEAEQLFYTPEWRADFPQVGLDNLPALREVIKAKMGAVLSEKSTHYNNDRAFLSAIGKLVQIAFEVRQRRANILRDLGLKLDDERLQELAAERENMEMIKLEADLDITVPEAGIGSHWPLHYLGYEKVLNGEYRAAPNLREYRTSSLANMPTLIVKNAPPAGYRLLSVDGHRDLEKWAESANANWKQDSDVKVHVELWKTYALADFNHDLCGRLRNQESAQNIAAFLRSNYLQEEIDLGDKGFDDYAGVQLLEAVELTTGELTTRHLILSANNFGMGTLGSLIKVVQKGCFQQLRLLELFRFSRICSDRAAMTSLMSGLAEHCLCLEVLGLGDIRLENALNDSAQALGTMLQRLTALRLTSNNFGPQVAAMFADAIEVAAAMLAMSNAFRDSGSKRRVSLPLKMFWFYGNPKMLSEPAIARRFLSALKHCGALEDLILADLGLQIAPAELSDTLVEMKGLQSLRLTACPDLLSNDVEGVLTTLKSLGDNTNVESLDIMRCGDITFGSELAKILPNLESLRKFGLMECQIDVAGRQAIACSLSKWTHLKEIILSQISLVGAHRDLIHHLPKSRCLTSLQLFDVELFQEDEKMCQDFVNALGSCRRLRKIALVNVGLASCAESLGGVLEEFSDLRLLDLNHNPGLARNDPEGSIAFCKCLHELALDELEVLQLENIGLCGTLATPGQEREDPASILIPLLPKFQSLRTGAFRMFGNNFDDDLCEVLRGNGVPV